MNTDLGMRPRHQNWRQRISESARGFEYGFGLDSYCEKFQETLMNIWKIYLKMNLSGVKQLSFGDYFYG